MEARKLLCVLKIAHSRGLERTTINYSRMVWSLLEILRSEGQILTFRGSRLAGRKIKIYLNPSAPLLNSIECGLIHPDLGVSALLISRSITQLPILYTAHQGALGDT